jgi:hypothetical protein
MFLTHNFLKIYFDACFSVQIVTLDQTRRLLPFSGSVALFAKTKDYGFV